ncbi:MAG: hypothetical protein WC437_03465 [Patescibacteria group bacterium]
MTRIIERWVDCFSQGVKAIIEELQTEATKLVPGTVLIEASYQLPDETHHVQYDEYRLRVHTAGPNPDFRSIYYKDTEKELTIHIRAYYEPFIEDHRRKILNGGISFRDKVVRDCDLVWAKKIPVDFKIFGLSDGAVLVTREEYRQISKSLRGGKRCRDLAEEYDREYLADLKRGPLSASDY